MRILCIIPARSGSKGIPDKNIKLLNGKPMIAYSIEQALSSKFRKLMRIIVSTDSQEYADISKKYGAEVPFLRPTIISQDLSTDEELIKHTEKFLRENEKYESDIIIQIRPTYPLRNIELIDDCIKIFIEKRLEYDSLRTVILNNKTPYKMYRIINNELIPYFTEFYSRELNKIIKEPYNQCRQILPKTYLHNGYVDIFNTEILKLNTISGNKIYPYIMNEKEIYDIDTINDFKNVEKILIN